MNITRYGREKNDKDDTGNVLLNLTCFYPSISWHKQWDLSLSGVVYVSLRGWSYDSERDLELFFFRNKYSDQFMSKIKIYILSCHETKQNTVYIDDLIINEHNM